MRSLDDWIVLETKWNDKYLCMYVHIYSIYTIFTLLFCPFLWSANLFGQDVMNLFPIVGRHLPPVLFIRRIIVFLCEERGYFSGEQGQNHGWKRMDESLWLENCLTVPVEKKRRKLTYLLVVIEVKKIRINGENVSWKVCRCLSMFVDKETNILPFLLLITLSPTVCFVSPTWCVAVVRLPSGMTSSHPFITRGLSKFFFPSP